MSPEHGNPGPASPADQPLELLIAQFIHAAGFRLASPEAAPGAVSRSEARALIELVAARGIAQGELGSLLGLEKSTVSRLAAGLERKGWVRRGRDAGNQRYVRLYLTDEGRSVAARLWHGWHARQARILGSLTEEERAGLALGLRGLVRAISADGTAAGAAEGTAAGAAEGTAAGAADSAADSAAAVAYRALSARPQRCRRLTGR